MRVPLTHGFPILRQVWPQPVQGTSYGYSTIPRAYSGLGAPRSTDGASCRTEPAFCERRYRLSATHATAGRTLLTLHRNSDARMTTRYLRGINGRSED